MMKKTYVFLILLAGLFLSASMTSCNDDGYSLDNFAVVIATVHTIDQQTFALETDGGSKLWIAAPLYNHYTVKEGDRVMANVTLLSDKKGDYDHYVKLNSMSLILDKPVIKLTVENADSIGDDPLQVEDIWYAGDRLNVIFGVNLGNEAVHFINLVENTTSSVPNDGKIHLELRHNRNGDKEVYGRKFIVNFDVRKYLSDGKAKTFVIRANTFNAGEKEYEITLTPVETKVNIDNEEIFVSQQDWE